MEGKIFFKIDWYSCMFYNCSLRRLITDFRPGFVESDVVSSCQTCMLMYEIKYRIELYPGVHLEFPKASEQHFIVDPKSEGHLLDIMFPSIKLDISGTGLDYLRQLPDPGTGEMRSDEPYFIWLLRHISDFFPEFQPNITRCDFAYDLINYAPTFIQDISTFYHHYYNIGDRILCLGNKGENAKGYKITIRNGAESSVYVGTPTSDKLLRIYDKKLQLCPDGAWKSDPPSDYLVDGQPPKSWIRLELQTRRDKAQSLILYDGFQGGSILVPLRYIFDNYAFRVPDRSYKDDRSRVLADFWQDLFEWDVIPQIVQNLHSVEVRSISEIMHEREQRLISQLVPVLAYYGLEKFVSDLNDFVMYVQSASFDKDPIAASWWVRTVNKLSGISSDGTLDSLPGLTKFNNVYYLKGL